MVSLPVFTTARLRLRPLRRGTDDEALFAVYGDERVMRHASDPPFGSLADVVRLHDSVERLLAAGLSFEWAVALRADDRLIGTCGLHSFDWPARQAEMGCLLARSHWGQGLMSEALRALMAHAAGPLGLRTLLADIDADNLRSQRLFTALGFDPRPDGPYQCRLAP